MSWLTDLSINVSHYITDRCNLFLVCLHHYTESNEQEEIVEETRRRETLENEQPQKELPEKKREEVINLHRRQAL